jgi:hypothetical protein
MVARTCCRCERPIGEAERTLVAVPFADSGAGGPALYACLPCARVYARDPSAPGWITEEIARTEARASRNGPP